MSKGPFSHLVQGRVPWRPWMQLRRGAPLVRPLARAKGSLGRAARRAAPPPDLPRPQPTVARHRLIVLCDWLESRLAKPLETTTGKDGSRFVVLFGCVAYSVRPRQTSIVAGKIIGGAYSVASYDFELCKPLFKSAWLRIVLEHLQLDTPRQDDLYFDREQDCHVAAWLEQTAFRLLCREAAFDKLRRVTLPRALGLPEDLKGIALAARPRRVSPMLDSATFNTVWRNEAAFRQLARENPQLLQLFCARVTECPQGRLDTGADPVAWLKGRVKSCGLPEAAWRYLVRHGSRLFKVAWSETGNQSAWEVAMEYLQMLAEAGLPPPPPPSIAAALIHAFNPHEGDEAALFMFGWIEVPPEILGIALREANRRRDGRLDEFRDEFVGVCSLAELTLYPPDPNQLKAGWPWLVRRLREVEAEEDAWVKGRNTAWPTRLEHFEDGPWRVVPIASLRDLFEEARAMRNCLRNWLDDCVAGKVEVVSIRDKASGKRRACAGFGFDKGRVELIDLKGFANTPPGSQIEALAEFIRHRLQAACTWEKTLGRG